MRRLEEIVTAARLARRELRGGGRGFIVFLACLVLGVASIAAVGSIGAAVTAGVQRDALALLGGDLLIESTNYALPDDEVSALVPDPLRTSRIVRTNAMAMAGERRVVTELKAVDQAHPLFGAVQLDPPMPLQQALADGGAVVERTLLGRLGIGRGDALRIGDATFEVRSTLVLEPDRLGGFLSIGPRTIIALDALPATGAILPGSLARYTYRFDLPAGVDAEALAERLEASNPEASWRVRSSSEVEPAFARFTDRLQSYLTIAGLTALLVGGVGIALAVQNYLGGKTTTIATLKCLGAPSRLVFRIYLAQVLALTTAGVLIGLALGALAPSALRLVPEAVLAVPVLGGFYLQPLLVAAASGYLAALTFTVWPLARARDTSAASMFRTLISERRARLPRRDLAMVGLMLLAFALIATLAVADWEIALIFVGVAAGAAIILAGTAHFLLLALGRLGRRRGGPLRLALANLRRPGSGSRGVVAALGAGLAVLTMVALLEHNLLAELEQRLPARAPAFFFIDIQQDQLERFERLVQASPGAAIIERAPMIRGRVVRINGAPIVEDRIAPDVRWTVRRDRGLTYGVPPPAADELVRGTWWGEDYEGPPLVSIDEEVAVGYGVGIGDRLSFSVLGRRIEAEVASTRNVDWETGGMNWLFVFSPGVLEAAPHTFVVTVENPAAGDAALIDAVTDALPNVTPISVRDVVAQLGAALAKIGLAIGAVAAVTLLSGMLVLAGAIAAARRRHLYEAVVLKVLGARRADLLRLFLLEYLGLGLTAGLAGALLGTAGAAVVVTAVMDLTWSFSPGVVAAVVGIGLVLILAFGFIGTWRLLGRPAAPVLRTA
jgi:putative ABC transport system permease protein